MKKIIVNLTLVLVLCTMMKDVFAGNAITNDAFCWAVGSFSPTTAIITVEPEATVRHNYPVVGRYEIIFPGPGWYNFTFEAEGYETYHGYQVITDNIAGCELEFQPVHLAMLSNERAMQTLASGKIVFSSPQIEGIRRKEEEMA